MTPVKFPLILIHKDEDIYYYCKETFQKITEEEELLLDEPQGVILINLPNSSEFMELLPIEQVPTSLTVRNQKLYIKTKDAKDYIFQTNGARIYQEKDLKDLERIYHIGANEEIEQKYKARSRRMRTCVDTSRPISKK